MKQEMMGWKWHQLDHMQIICTPLHTGNHADTSSLSFYKPDDHLDAQPTVVSKHGRPQSINQSINQSNELYCKRNRQ